ncbi:hypothetical protein, partial [Parabacteroides goldsteinii]|uniref:hypothetical protein n=1 Tax=Parabacteroides goldsteinii TaxID=328812 RepID=UPI00256F026B
MNKSEAYGCSAAIEKYVTVVNGKVADDRCRRQYHEQDCQYAIYFTSACHTNQNNFSFSAFSTSSGVNTIPPRRPKC